MTDARTPEPPRSSTGQLSRRRAGQPRRAAGGVVLVAAVSVAVAGCGSQRATGTAALRQQSPAQELAAAYRANASGAGLTTTVRLLGSAADLARATQGHGTPAAASSALADTRLVIAARSAPQAQLTGLARLQAVQEQVTLVTGHGAPQVELRLLHGTLYLRADIGGLVRAFGSDPAPVQAQLTTAATAVPALHTLVTGGWASLNLSALLALLPNAQALTASPNPAQSAAARGALDQLLTQVAVTRVSSVGGTDRLSLSGNVRELFRGAIGVAGTLGSAATAPLAGALGRIPDRTAVATAVVTAGRLTELSIDLTQFVGDGRAAVLQGRPLGVDVTFARSAPEVSAPAASTPLDLSALAGLFRVGQHQVAVSGGSATLRATAPSY